MHAGLSRVVLIVIRGSCAVGGIKRHPAVVAAAKRAASHGVVGRAIAVLLCFPLNAHAASIGAAAGGDVGHFRHSGDTGYLLDAVERRVLRHHHQSVIIVRARVRHIIVAITARENGRTVDGLSVYVHPVRVVVHAALQHHVVGVAVVGIAERL